MALSAFVKKLLFARQFEIDSGKVNVLGKRKVMLDPEFIQKIKDKDMVYRLSKESIKDNAEYFKKHMGIHGERLLDFFLHIFETQGFGNIDIINMNKDKKTASFSLSNSPFRDNNTLVAGSLAGMLCVLFNSDVDVEETSKPRAHALRFEVKSKA